jgi:hypothetical protein
MKRISNFLAWYNQQTTASDQAFTKAVIIGFFVGFGMVINLIPPEEIKKWDLNSLPFILLFGFTFWGFGMEVQEKSKPRKSFRPIRLVAHSLCAGHSDRVYPNATSIPDR